MHLPHPDDDELRGYLEGRLSDPARLALENHLESCPACLARLARLDEPPDSNLRELLREALQLRPPDVPGYAYEAGPDGLPLRLGQGGIGVVYKARSREDGRPVAVKFLQVGPDQDLLQRYRFVRETEAVVGLSHEGIVKALDCNAVGGRLYYVMEFVDGKDLFQFQRRRPLSLPPGTDWARGVAGWGARLADAIEHANRSGVVHRDLKPGNVMVAGDDEPQAMKITDFGMVRRFNGAADLSSQGQPAGTLRYMAPELLRRQEVPEEFRDGDRLTPAVDVYGLGGILYYMLTGNSLFHQHASVQAITGAVLNEDPAPPSRWNPAVPYDLDTVVLKCLRKGPADRYESAANLAADLRRFVAGKPLLARRRPWQDRAFTWARKNRTAALVLLTISTLLVAAVLFLSAALSYAARERAQKQQAERLEGEAKQQAFERQLEAARVELGRGQLAAALPLYDKAVEEAKPDRRPEIEVERLHCLVVFGQWERLQAELDRLQRRDDLPAKLRAAVLLHRGDLKLWDPAPDSQAAGHDHVCQALDVPDGLSPADAAYARGLLTDSSNEALEEFRQALGHDKFHLRANACLLIELVLTGQFEPARRRADFMAAVFPDEPVTPLALALIATLEEDAPGRARHLAELRRLIADPGRMEGFEGLFGSLDRTIRANHDAHRPPSAWRLFRLRPPPRLETVFAGNAIDLMRRGAVVTKRPDVPPVIGVGLPVLARLVGLTEGLTRAYQQLAAGDYDDADALADELRRKHPESLVRLVQATACLYRAQALEKQRDLAGCFRESRRAHDLAEEAADAPTLIPFGPYRHNARWLCVVIEAGWGAQYRFDAANLAATSALAPAAGNPLAAAAVLTAGGERLAAYPARRDRRHLLRVAADSGAYDEARSDLLPQLLPYFEADDARLLLADWAGDAPDDSVPFRLRAGLELSLGNAGESLLWAERGLARHPGDGELRQARERAGAALKRGGPAPQ